MRQLRRVIVIAAMAGAFVLLAAGRGGAASPSTSTTAPAATASGSVVHGVLTLNGGPVNGVRITASQGGREIAHATSDATGAWQLSVPEPGTYQLALDTSTLPNGVHAARPQLPAFRVFGGFPQQAIFSLSTGKTSTSTGPSRFNRFANLIVAGIRFGLIVGLCSVGLSLIYGTTGLVNFAHGELVTFGALIAWLFSTMTSGPKLSLVVATLIAVVATGLLGGSLELGIFRPMTRRRSGPAARMLASIGLALVLRYLFQVIFTGTPRAFRQYAAPAPVKLWVLELPVRDWVTMAICVVALVAVGLVLQRTKLGTGVRAVADERDLASASGIDVNRVVLAVWIGGAALAGLGGVLLALSESVQWNMGFRLLLTMFAAVVLGGLGSAYGAMAGGLIVGVASEVSTYWFPSDIQFAVGLVILIIVLLVRPQGLLGVQERVG